MKIEIWSDIMCPFCYIGKRHFEVAKAQVPFRDEIEVVWKSFQLDPTLPTQASGETVAEYLTKRKGMSIEQSQGMLQQITERGKAVGITFNQEKSIPVNTLQAHRMIHFAQANGKASQMEEALFKAYFTDNKNIGDSEVLINLAASIELDKQEAADYLASDKGIEQVKADILEAQKMKVSGVPFFVIDRTYAISGAQPINMFAQTLRQAYAEKKEKELETAKSNPDAGTCDTDSCAT